MRWQISKKRKRPEWFHGLDTPSTGNGRESDWAAKYTGPAYLQKVRGNRPCCSNAEVEAACQISCYHEDDSNNGASSEIEMCPLMIKRQDLGAFSNQAIIPPPDRSIEKNISDPWPFTSGSERTNDKECVASETPRLKCSTIPRHSGDTEDHLQLNFGMACDVGYLGGEPVSKQFSILDAGQAGSSIIETPLPIRSNVDAETSAAGALAMVHHELDRHKGLVSATREPQELYNAALLVPSKRGEATQSNESLQVFVDHAECKTNVARDKSVGKELRSSCKTARTLGLRKRVVTTSPENSNANKKAPKQHHTLQTEQQTISKARVDLSVEQQESCLPYSISKLRKDGINTANFSITPQRSNKMKHLETGVGVYDHDGKVELTLFQNASGRSVRVSASSIELAKKSIVGFNARPVSGCDASRREGCNGKLLAGNARDQDSPSLFPTSLGNTAVISEERLAEPRQPQPSTDIMKITDSPLDSLRGAGGNANEFETTRRQFDTSVDKIPATTNYALRSTEGSLFQTASGRAVCISRAKLQEASQRLEVSTKRHFPRGANTISVVQDLCNDIPQRDKEFTTTESQNVAETHWGSCAKRSDQTAHSDALQTLTQSGSGRSIQCARTSLEHGELPAGQLEGSVYCNTQLGPPMPENSTQPDNSQNERLASLFQTASGRKVKISRQTLDAAARKFVGSAGHIDTNSRHDDEEPSTRINEYKIARYQNGSVSSKSKLDGREISLFQTASGKDVCVSREQLQEAAGRFEKDLEATNYARLALFADNAESFNHQGNRRLTSPRQTAQTALPSSKQERIFESLTEKEHFRFPGMERDSSPSMKNEALDSLFQTATGKSIVISKQSLDTASRQFKDLTKVEFSADQATGGNAQICRYESVHEQLFGEKQAAYAGTSTAIDVEVGKNASSLFQTASGKGVCISRERLQAAVKHLDGYDEASTYDDMHQPSVGNVNVSKLVGKHDPTSLKASKFRSANVAKLAVFHPRAPEVNTAILPLVFRSESNIEKDDEFPTATTLDRGTTENESRDVIEAERSTTNCKGDVNFKEVNWELCQQASISLNQCSEKAASSAIKPEVDGTLVSSRAELGYQHLPEAMVVSSIYGTRLVEDVFCYQSPYSQIAEGDALPQVISNSTKRHTKNYYKAQLSPVTGLYTNNDDKIEPASLSEGIPRSKCPSSLEVCGETHKTAILPQTGDLVLNHTTEQQTKYPGHDRMMQSSSRKDIQSHQPVVYERKGPSRKLNDFSQTVALDEQCSSSPLESGSKYSNANAPADIHLETDTLNFGVSPVVYGVSASNAVLLTFDARGKPFKLSTQATEPAAILETLKSSDDSCALLTIKWVANHYRWIVWKLASLERNYPQRYGGKLLTRQNVIVQLHSRHRKEILDSKKSCLKKILQHEAHPGRLCILCVAGIRCQAKALDNVVVILTDGWYAIESTLDQDLVTKVLEKKIYVGQKLAVCCAKLSDCDVPIDPLEYPLNFHAAKKSDSESLCRLQLSINGTRIARYDAQLGFQRCPSIHQRLCHVRIGGGLIPTLRVCVIRIYPVMTWRESPDGGKHAMQYEEFITVDETKSVDVIAPVPFVRVRVCSIKRDGSLDHTLHGLITVWRPTEAHLLHIREYNCYVVNALQPQQSDPQRAPIEHKVNVLRLNATKATTWVGLQRLEVDASCLQGFFSPESQSSEELDVCAVVISSFVMEETDRKSRRTSSQKVFLLSSSLTLYMLDRKSYHRLHSDALSRSGSVVYLRSVGRGAFDSKLQINCLTWSENSTIGTANCDPWKADFEHLVAWTTVSESQRFLQSMNTAIQNLRTLGNPPRSHSITGYVSWDRAELNSQKVVHILIDDGIFSNSVFSRAENSLFCNGKEGDTSLLQNSFSEWQIQAYPFFNGIYSVEKSDVRSRIVALLDLCGG